MTTSARATTATGTAAATIPDPMPDGGGVSAATVHLVATCRASDREALRTLFDTHKDRVYSLALAFFHGDTATAEDLTQEVFVKMATRIGEFRSEAALATWLYRLVMNACVDEQRRRKRLVPLASEREGSGESMPASDCLAERREMTSAVRSAVAALPPDLRLAVLLRYFDDLSYEEIARALGCAPGTVASRLHRGLKRLGRVLATWRNDAE